MDVYWIFLPVSLSFLSFLLFRHTSRPTYAQMCSLRSRFPERNSNSGVRGVPQTALNLSDLLMLVGFLCPWAMLRVRILMRSITSSSLAAGFYSLRDLSLRLTLWQRGLNDFSEVLCITRKLYEEVNGNIFIHYSIIIIIVTTTVI